MERLALTGVTTRIALCLREGGPTPAVENLVEVAKEAFSD